MSDNQNTNHIKDVNLIERLFTIEAKLDTIISAQAQIISRIENRDADAVYKNLLKNVGEFLQDKKP